MLNKIKVIGMFLGKKQPENKIDNVNSISQETENETDTSSSKFEAEERNNKEPWFRFGLLAFAPSGSKFTLRCIAQGEVAERIQKEVSQEEVIEVRGYLRNKRVGLEIVIKIAEFNKTGLTFAEFTKLVEKKETKDFNQVRLLGKIITDLQSSKNKFGREKLSFKLAVPREKVEFPLYFCRVNEKELIPEFKKKLKKGDIIILEGFLQTQKTEKVVEGETKIEKFSSVNCYGFTFLDSDSVNIFSPLDNLTRVLKEVKGIDFDSEPEIEA